MFSIVYSLYLILPSETMHFLTYTYESVLQLNKQYISIIQLFIKICINLNAILYFLPFLTLFIIVIDVV